MAKEWANKDRYHPSHGVPKSRMPLPRGKAIVRTGSAWELRVLRVEGTLLEELILSDWFGGSRVANLVFVLVMRLSLGPSVVVQMVGMVCLVVLSLLGVLHLVLNTRAGKVITLSIRGATDYGLPFIAFFLLQLDRGGSLVVVPMVLALI
jgi:hypothetical protein